MSAEWRSLRRVGFVNYGPTAGSLTLVHLPISFRMETHLQQTVLGVVSLAAARADQVTALGRALMIIIFRHRKGCSATARDEEHP
jgi:hypothetical protein